MAASKLDLSRAGTMDVTAKEGTSFLNKNLTEWKKPYLMPNIKDDEEEASADEAAAGESGSAEEDGAPNGDGSDAEAEAEVAPPAKKVRLSKATTMVGTAKEGKSLLAGEKLADTRQETKLVKQHQANKLKRATTMAKTKQEAEAVYGDNLDLSEGRSLRKRAAAEVAEKKARAPSIKKAGTMQVTAKEGEAYLKRTTEENKGKAKGKGKGKK